MLLKCPRNQNKWLLVCTCTQDLYVFVLQRMMTHMQNSRDSSEFSITRVMWCCTVLLLLSMNIDAVLLYLPWGSIQRSRNVNPDLNAFLALSVFSSPSPELLPRQREVSTAALSSDLCLIFLTLYNHSLLSSLCILSLSVGNFTCPKLLLFGIQKH